MANIDQSLDDMIRKSERRGPQRGGRPAGNQARQRAQPYAARSTQSRSSRNNDDSMMSGGEELKAGSGTIPNKLAGAICNAARTSGRGPLPAVMATGPAAINQAIKGIAIARKYLLEDDEPMDLLVQPMFEQDLREGSNVRLQLLRANPIDREPTEDDLSAKEKTDCFKLAGAIAGRVRDREQVAVTTKGSVPVLVTIKAAALAQDYLADDGIDLKFMVQFRDLEDPELNNAPSTYLHFAILTGKLK